MNIFRIAFQTIEHLLPWKAKSKLDTGGRYLQELFNSYGQIPGKGKPTNIFVNPILSQYYHFVIVCLNSITQVAESNIEESLCIKE